MVGSGRVPADIFIRFSQPRVPSGKLDHLNFQPDTRIAGTGDVPSALTDLRDIGRYFARLVRDARTENKYVLVYNELWTQHQIWDALSRASGEEVLKTYTSAAELETSIAAAQAELDNGATGFAAGVKLIGAQYQYSWGVRGDNTPEYAKYLGYVTSKELYPEFEGVGFEAYLKELVGGGVKGVYEDRRAEIQKAFNEAAR